MLPGQMTLTLLIVQFLLVVPMPNSSIIEGQYLTFKSRDGYIDGLVKQSEDSPHSESKLSPVLQYTVLPEYHMGDHFCDVLGGPSQVPGRRNQLPLYIL